MIDAGESHIDLLLNCYLSLELLGSCDEYVMLAYDSATNKTLSDLGFTTEFDPFDQAIVSKLSETDQCDSYLLGPMLLRVKLLTRLVVAQKTRVIQTDADVVFYRDMFEYLGDSDGMVVTGYIDNDITKNTGWDWRPWYRPHGVGPTWLSLNNGVIGVTPSQTNTQIHEELYRLGWLPSICQHGFGQTVFNRYAEEVLKIKLTEASDGIWVDRYGNDHLFVVPTADQSSNVDPYSVGGRIPLLVHAVGIGTSSERAAWLRSRNNWLLRDDWKIAASRLDLGSRGLMQSEVRSALLNVSAVSVFSHGTR